MDQRAQWEQRAQQIIHEELLMDVTSYAEVRRAGFTGYVDLYLTESTNHEKMSNSAEYNVMLELASIDQYRDRNTTSIVFSKFEL